VTPFDWPNQKVIGAHVDTSNWTFFRETIFRPLGVLAPQIFARPNSPINCISSRTLGTGQPQFGLCPIFLVVFVCTDIRQIIQKYLSIMKITKPCAVGTLAVHT